MLGNDKEGDEWWQHDDSGDDETTELVDLILSGRLVTPTGLKDDDDDDDGDGDDDGDDANNDEDCRGLI